MSSKKPTKVGAVALQPTANRTPTRDTSPQSKDVDQKTRSSLQDATRSEK